MTPPPARRRLSSPSEASVVQNIVRHLTGRGAWVTKTHGGRYGKRGVPDLLACYRGRLVAIEVKRLDAPASAVTELQRINIELIHRAGGIALVARSVDDVRPILDLVDQQASPDA